MKLYSCDPRRVDDEYTPEVIAVVGLGAATVVALISGIIKNGAAATCLHLTSYKWSLYEHHTVEEHE